MTKREWKIVAATITIIGVVFTLLEKFFAPNVWVDGTAVSGYDFISWVSLVMTSVAPLAYIGVDHWEDIRGWLIKKSLWRQNDDTEYRK